MCSSDLRETTARRIRARHQPRLRRKLQSSSGSPAAISALLAVHGVGEAVGSGVERRGGVVRWNLSSGRAAFIGGARSTVGRAQGRCNGRPGMSVGLARGRLRCWAMEGHGGWRGGMLGELEWGTAVCALGRRTACTGTGTRCRGRPMPVSRGCGARLGEALGGARTRWAATVLPIRRGSAAWRQWPCSPGWRRSMRRTGSSPCQNGVQGRSVRWGGVLGCKESTNKRTNPSI